MSSSVLQVCFLYQPQSCCSPTYSLFNAWNRQEAARWVELLTEFKIAVTDLDWWKSLWDAEAFLVYFGWYAFCLVAWAILPGDWGDGQQMRNGNK